MNTKLGDVFRSRKSALTVSVAADAIWQLPGEIIAPLISFFSGFVATPIMATGSTWLMFGVAAYSLAHLAYPRTDAFPTTDSGFRAIFAGSALLFASLMHYSPQPFVVVGVSSLFLSAVMILLFLKLSHDWSLFDANGEAVRVLIQVFQDETTRREIRQSFETDGIEYYVFGGAGVLAVGLLLAFPAVLGGLIIEIMFNTYPIPDVLFLSWVFVSVVYANPETVQTSAGQPPGQFDLEESLFDTLSRSLHGMVGFAMTIFCLLGLFVFGLSTHLATTFVPLYVSAAVSGGETLLSSFLMHGVQILTWESTWTLAQLIWNVAGFVFLLVGTALYGFWAWFRELKRVPHFLASRQERITRPGPLPTRPVGFVIPAIVAMAAQPLYMAVVNDVGGINERTFAAVWPIIAVVLLGSVYWTHIRDPQPPDHEFGVIVGGLWLVAVVFPVIWTASVFEPLLSGVIPPLGPIAVPVAISILIPGFAVISLAFQPSQGDDR